MKMGISSCLLGQMCRYNGGHAKDDFVMEVIHTYFDVIAFCPEAVIFGTPREAIRLFEDENGINVITTKENKNVTHALMESSKGMVEQIKEEGLCGFILKSNSPTCGLERVKIYDAKNPSGERRGIGVFANEIRKQFPHLPLEEEGRLQDAWLRENFMMQVFAYQEIHEFLAASPKMGDLVEFHSKYKYLIYAKSHQSYKALGSIVANHSTLALKEVLSLYTEAFLKAIALKGTVKKTYNVLIHIYGYFKKEIEKEEKEEVLLCLQEFKEGIIPLIAAIKMLNLYVKRFDITYLKTQKFLNPYPKELALRSSIKAYK